MHFSPFYLCSECCVVSPPSSISWALQTQSFVTVIRSNSPLALPNPVVGRFEYCSLCPAKKHPIPVLLVLWQNHALGWTCFIHRTMPKISPTVRFAVAMLQRKGRLLVRLGSPHACSCCGALKPAYLHIQFPDGPFSSRATSSLTVCVLLTCWSSRGRSNWTPVSVAGATKQCCWRYEISPDIACWVSVESVASVSILTDSAE